MTDKGWKEYAQARGLVSAALRYLHAAESRSHFNGGPDFSRIRQIVKDTYIGMHCFERAERGNGGGVSEGKEESLLSPLRIHSDPAANPKERHEQRA